MDAETKKLEDDKFKDNDRRVKTELKVRYNYYIPLVIQ